ncbi:hypothetical protein ACHAW6_008877 [Cyclotella cf. meneghiniana]
MCGIGLLISLSQQEHHCQDVKEWNNLLSKTLSNRGPDVPRHLCHYEFGDKRNVRLTLHGSVLHMRGATPRAQPLLFSLHPSTDVFDRCRGYASEQHENVDDDAMTEIPVNADDCALCWNGECYTCSVDYDEEPYQNGGMQHGTMVELVADTHIQVAATNNSYPRQKAEQFKTIVENSDTMLVKDLLLQCIAKARQNRCSDDLSVSEHEAITMTMARVHGEYSFLLYVPSSQASSGTLQPQQHSSKGYVYYGRDELGRRSLLINRSINGVVVISSVATSFHSQKNQLRDGNSLIGDRWEELPPGIVYRMDLATGEISSKAIQRIINKDVEFLVSSVTSATINDDLGNKSILISDSIVTKPSIEHAAKFLLLLLDKSIQRRVMHAPTPKSQNALESSVAVLFSGGIDSVILAALSHRHIPSNKPIDLINVSFYDDSDSFLSAISPDRLAALHSYCELTAKWPERNWRFIAVDVSYREVLEEEAKVLQLINPLDSTMDFNIAVAFWFAGRGKGRIINREKANKLVQDIGNHSETQRKTTPSQEPLLRFAKVNTSMASNESTKSASTHKTAATHFSKQRAACIRDGCARPAPLYGCVFHACKFCCGKFQSPISKFLGRSAQLCPVHNNGDVVSFRDSKNVQTPASCDKVLSCENDSHSCRSSENDNPSVVSSAKILLSGVGADEQMAGYGRHRSTFQRGGYAMLRDELKMEVRRLWIRNLGRDDRCLSDCGKEARFPYLDEDVVAFLEEMPLHLKCNLNLPPGDGDKLILRRVARLIGIDECSTLVKRAIQFGSRIAKVSDKNRFGSQRRASGGAKHVCK